MKTKKSGIIYRLGYIRYGLAVHSEQTENYTRYNKLFLRLFSDIECEVPVVHEVTGKPLCAVKSANGLEIVGFID